MRKQAGAVCVGAAIMLAMTMIYGPIGGIQASASMTDIDVNNVSTVGDTGETPSVAGVNDPVDQQARPDENAQTQQQSSTEMQRTDVNIQSSSSGSTSDRVSTAIDAAFGEMIKTPQTQAEDSDVGTGAVNMTPKSQEEVEEEEDSMPEWTEKLVTGRGESESGFSGNTTDLGKVAADYEGMLDPVTGMPADDEYTSKIVTSDGANEPLTGRVKLTDIEYYDYDQNGYIFLSTRFGIEVGCNVADGMVTRDTVVVSVPDGVTVTLYRDGNVVEKPVLGGIRVPGAYVVRLGNGSENEDLITFTITDSITGKLNYYDMPEGFQLTEVTRDGEDVMASRSRVELLEEGEYKIAYRCPKTEMKYELNVSVDHTPPEIKFTGLNENNTARGPVSFSGLEQGDTITCKKDGNEYKLRGNKMTASGRYEITVTDRAGNESVYFATILLYLNMQGVIFLGLFLVVIIAVVVYLYWVKKNLRVR
ncbi:MAG: hypothetical protein K6E75_06865 [Lachnospiraceae bacterium]|nr:hypothetical protein [Lachnospiraceae bacterium]